MIPIYTVPNLIPTPMTYDPCNVHVYFRGVFVCILIILKYINTNRPSTAVSRHVTIDFDWTSRVIDVHGVDTV